MSEMTAGMMVVKARHLMTWLKSSNLVTMHQGNESSEQLKNGLIGGKKIFNVVITKDYDVYENSLAVRIPKETANFLNLKEGNEAYIYSEKGKIIIESEAY